MNRRDDIAANLTTIEERVRAACSNAGRNRADVTLVVVTKYHPVSDIDLLVSLGVADVGENREQEATTKMADLRARWTVEDLRLHFIGQVQTNKVRRVAAIADAVHSVDRPRLVTALDQAVGHARAERRRTSELSVAIQVDLQPVLAVSSTPGRGGAHPDEVMSLADQVASTGHLRLAGLMCVAPLGVEPDRAFEHAAALSARLQASYPEARWLSAGMSHDLEAAIQHGATHLRVGTAILGPRPAAQ